jgi:hypothetical protein
LFKEVSESLNRSMWVFCWIREEQRGNWVPTLEDVCKRRIPGYPYFIGKYLIFSRKD